MGAKGLINEYPSGGHRMKRSSASTRVCFLLSVLVLLLGINSASGAVITFAPLPGPNGAPYGGHVEAGFTVTPTLGMWFQGLMFGNPAPSIFAPGMSEIEVIDTSLPFTFTSLDYSSNNGASDFVIEGFLGDVLVFAEAGVLVGSFPPVFLFNTLASAFPGALIDTLLIQVSPGPEVSSINLDNIDVSKQVPGQVPEPSTLLLLAFGLAGLATQAWKRHRRK
jgi:PEP-CTERM motif